MTTPNDFALALLSGLGLPMTQNNIDAMVSAEAIEGGFMANSATYNPLNVTQTIAGSSTASGFGPGQTNTVPIQAFSTWAAGLQATINLFKNGLYSDILGSFQASAAPATTLAVWGKNPHYGWTTTPAVNTAYGAETFPQGPSSVPLVVPPLSGASPQIVNTSKIAGTALAAFVFWQLFKLLGK